LSRQSKTADFVIMNSSQNLFRSLDSLQYRGAGGRRHRHLNVVCCQTSGRVCSKVNSMVKTSVVVGGFSYIKGKYAIFQSKESRMKSLDPNRPAQTLSCASSLDGEPVPEASPILQEQKPKGLSSLGKRAVFGSILGLMAAVVIFFGGWAFAGVTCLIAYQCSQEFIGLVNATGIAKGMKPPPPIVSSAISLLCVGLCAWSYISGGKMASAMAVAAFLVMSLQLVAVEKPKFSQLTSSVFGLMYCGKSFRLRVRSISLGSLEVNSHILPIFSGYLPSFWIKLRLLAVPAPNSILVQSWQVRGKCCLSMME